LFFVEVLEMSGEFGDYFLLILRREIERAEMFAD
jgi:hypothetical protein